jgi:hypothetical protein
MTKLPVRLTLLLACVVAIGYAAFLTWSSDQRLRINDAASRQFTTTARGPTAEIAELRAAQQAYVAVGQGEDFWIGRVASLVTDLHRRLTTLKGAATTPEAATAVDDAVGALQDFEQMDRRARDYARGRQLAQASDLVFTDGFDLTKKAGDAVERAVVAELVAADAAAADHRRRQAYALAGAAGVALLGLLLLLPVKRKPDVQPTYVEIGDMPARSVSAETLEDLQDFGVVTKPVTAVQPDQRTRSQVDIGGMAALCVELARIQDTRSLPTLLGRAGEILQASGIVLWIADPDGRELSPIVVHGYPPNLASRFGTIVRDAENVTASAYRTGLLQVMKADPISNGAVAAPLVTSGGCVGVMAAEMKNGGEQQDALLAAATIVAAQLATLVGPPAARAKTEAAS